MKNSQRKKLIPLLCAVTFMLTSCAHNDNTANTQEEKLDANTTTIAFGDSTMSLSEGDPIEQEKLSPYNPCHVETPTWVDLVGGVPTNLSCPGSHTKDALQLAEQTPLETLKPNIVFITTGSNQMRENISISDSTDTMINLVNTIKNKTPEADIIFVGYLPLKHNKKCITEEHDTKYAHHIDNIHNRADQAMREAARRTHTKFINNRNLRYNICEEDTYIRLPNTAGTPWHTTLQGHQAIANNILKHIDDN